MEKWYPVLAPAPHPITGHLKLISKNMLDLYAEATPHGDFVKYRILTFWSYLIRHPDLIQEFLVKRASSFHKIPILVKATQEVVDDNLFNMDGERWKKQRKVIQPAFHSKRIGAYADTMVSLTQTQVQNWQDGEVIDIAEMMADITMHIIVETMFHANIDDVLDGLAPTITELFAIMGASATTLLKPPSWMPTERNRRLKAGREKLNAIYERVMTEWRKTGEDRGDLLSMLMMARYDDGSPMSDKQIMAELGTIFLAGHETTATALTFAWYALSQHPHIVEKLHEEVDRVLAGRPATLLDLKELVYTEQIIKETMRLYPPATGVTRVAIEDVEIGGYLIKKGQNVTVPFWILHRDERWYTDPLKFDPSRWQAEIEEQLPRYAYLPFGAGPRVCVGNQFAMMEAQFVLATIAQNFEMNLEPGTHIKPEVRFTLHPGVDKLLMKLQKRPLGN